MRSIVPIAVSCCMALFLLSCQQAPPPEAVKMGVEFSWSSTEDPGGISPEISLTQIPDGTEKFLVEMKDLDFPMADHGSGHVDYSQEPVIKAGAVKGTYVGPRPPPGKVHNYQFTVKALDKDGKLIGIGIQSRPYPES